jgi:hypothetical protein
MPKRTDISRPAFGPAPGRASSKRLIIGADPINVGQACAFDTSGAQVVKGPKG